MGWSKKGCAMCKHTCKCLTEIVQQPPSTDGVCLYHRPQDSSTLTPGSVCFVTSLSVHAAETRGSTERLQVFWMTPWEFVRKLSVLTILPWVTLDRTPSLTFFVDTSLSCVFVNGSVCFLWGFFAECFLVLMCHLVFVAKCGDMLAGMKSFQC